MLLRELQLDGSLQYRIVFMQRPIDEVLASQRAMLLRDGKASADAAVLKQAFERQLEQIDTGLAAQAHVVVMRVPCYQIIQPLARGSGLGRHAPSQRRTTGPAVGQVGQVTRTVRRVQVVSASRSAVDPRQPLKPSAARCAGTWRAGTRRPSRS